MFIWVILTAVALAVGMQVGGSAVDLVGLYSLAALMNLAAIMWAAGIALRFRSIQAGPLMQTPTFLILFLAPVYVPIEPADRLGRGGGQREPGHARWWRPGAS